MEKKIPLPFLFCIVILLATASQAHSQDFFKGTIISNGGNSPLIYSLVDGTIYKFNSESIGWDEKGNVPASPNWFVPSYQLDNRGYIWTVTSNGTIMYTEDEGTSWNAFEKYATAGVLFFKIIGEQVYSTSYIDGYKTYRKNVDGTGDWEVVNIVDPPTDMTVTANGSIYMSTGFKVLKSADNGATWTNTGGPDYAFPSTPTILTAIGDKVFLGSYWYGVYYSDDEGASWTNSTGFPINGISIGTRGVSSIIIRNETEVFALAKDQVGCLGWYKSNDGGQTFQPLNFSYNHWVVLWVDGMGLSGDDIVISAGYRGFIHTNDNGTTWTEVNNGVNNLKPHHVAKMMKDNNGELFALMTNGHFSAGPGDSWGLLKSSDNGVSWEQTDDQVVDTYNTLEDLLVTNNGDMYVTTYIPGTYLKSEDNGVTWQQNAIAGGSWGAPSTLVMMKEVGLDSILIASYFNNIWRTYDGGATWTELIIKPGAGASNFDTSGDNIYAISKDQVGYNGLYKSTDLGDTWALIDVIGGHHFEKIKIVGTSLFATKGAFLYRSEDDGVNWVDVTPVVEGGIGAVYCMDVLETTSPGGRSKTTTANLLLGTFVGLFSTPLETTQWKKVANGAIWSIGTQGGDVYVGTATDATVKTASEAVKEIQSITSFSLPSRTFGDASFEISATATSGLPVTFASGDLNVATIVGTTVTIVGAGSTLITASQGGNNNFSAASPLTQTLVVYKAGQTITFNPLPGKDVTDIPFTVSAVSSAGLPVSFSSDNLLVATVDGNTITITGEGTAKITASQAGNNNYHAPPPVDQNLTVTTKASQTITFSAIADGTLGDAAFPLTASSNSQLPVTFSTTSDKINIAENQVTLVKAGRASVTANQAGNDIYYSAPPVDRSFCIKPVMPTVAVTGADTPTQTFTSSASAGNQWFKDGEPLAGQTGSTLIATNAGIYKVHVTVDDCVSEFSTEVIIRATQTIAFSPIAVRTLGDATFALTATSTSDLPVAFTTTSDKISIAANQVTLVKAGRATVTANQAGNDYYYSAPPVDQSFCIKPVKPTVTVSGTNTGPPTLTSNASTGNQWFKDGEAIAGETGATIVANTAGMYKVHVKVDDCVSEFSTDVTVKATQTITFPAIADRTMGGAVFTPTATSTSGLPVTISTTSDKISISTNQVTMVKAGRAIVTANQAGNDSYYSAPPVDQSFCIKPAMPTVTVSGANPASQTLTSSASTGNQWFKDGSAIPGEAGSTMVATTAGIYNVQVQVDDCVSEFSTDVVIKATQTIAFSAIDDRTLGDAAFALTAPSTSSLPVAFSSTSDKITIAANQVTLVKPGRVIVKANQPGNDDYYPAPQVEQSFCIKPARPTVTSSGTNPLNQTLTSSASTGNQWFKNGVAIAGETGSIFVTTTKGIYKVRVKVDDCTSEFSTDVAIKVAQTITFPTIADRTLGDAAFTPSATSTSGLPVTFSTTSDKITIAANQITLVTAGRASVTANQAGNDGFHEAPPVEQSFCIKPMMPVITVSASAETPLLTSSASTGNQWYKDGIVIPDGTGNVFTATAVGVYKVQVTVDDCISEFSNDLVLVVTGGLHPENEEITVYPNPVEDYFELSGIRGEVGNAQLFDMTGRASSLVLEKSNDVQRGNVRHLTTGIYLLRIQVENSILQVKLLKK